MKTPINRVDSPGSIRRRKVAVEQLKEHGIVGNTLESKDDVQSALTQIQENGKPHSRNLKQMLDQLLKAFTADALKSTTRDSRTLHRTRVKLNSIAARLRLLQGRCNCLPASTAGKPNWNPLDSRLNDLKAFGEMSLSSPQVREFTTETEILNNAINAATIFVQRAATTTQTPRKQSRSKFEDTELNATINLLSDHERKGLSLADSLNCETKTCREFIKQYLPKTEQLVQSALTQASHRTNAQHQLTACSNTIQQLMNQLISSHADRETALYAHCLNDDDSKVETLLNNFIASEASHRLNVDHLKHQENERAVLESRVKTILNELINTRNAFQTEVARIESRLCLIDRIYKDLEFHIQSGFAKFCYSPMFRRISITDSNSLLTKRLREVNSEIALWRNQIGSLRKAFISIP